MPMNLLQMVQEVRGRLGQTVPATVIANSDAGIIQCRGLLNEFLEDLHQRKKWQVNTREATFVSTATESQGTLATLAPYGFEGILPNTFFNRTTKLQVAGGMSPQEWAARKAMGVSGPLPAYRLRQDELLMSPTPTAGDTYTFEYASSYFVASAAPTTYSKYWTADTDTCTLGDSLPMAYLKWAWLKAKGMDYGEEFRKYETMVATKSLRENPKAPIRMDDTCDRSAGPGMIVAPGSWPL